MNFGKTILELRKQKNVTQEEMAAELGVTAAAVSKWENNYTLPDILMLCALADYFDVTTDELLGRIVNWKYAVIAADTPALGEKIKLLARQYGIAGKQICGNWQEAVAAAREDAAVTMLLIGAYQGFDEDEDVNLSGFHTVMSVSKTDQEILDGLELMFQKMK